MDYDGSETYTLSVKNINTGELLSDMLEDISGEVNNRLWERERGRERGGKERGAIDRNKQRDGNKEKEKE